MSAFLDIAEEVLKYSQGKPMGVRAIWMQAERLELVPASIRGKTPTQTLKSKLSVDIRTKGEASKFARVGPGKFVLRRDLTGAEFEAPRPPLPGSRDEPVVAIDVAALPSSMAFQGVRGMDPGLLAEITSGKNLVVLPRTLAEQNYAAKQLVVYVIIRREGFILAFTRGMRNRVEDYLKGMRCVGFGGHVSDADLPTLYLDDHSGLMAAAVRELTEELRLSESTRLALHQGEGLRFLGVINDDSSDNGRRHLGVVVECLVSGTRWDHPISGEQSINQVDWIDPQDPDLDLMRFEYWSQLVLREFYDVGHSGSARYRVLHRRAVNDPDVVCLVGPVGSGKTTIATSLEHLRFRKINTGLLVAECLGIPPVPDTPREAFQQAAYDFIASPSGPEVLVARIVEDIGGDKYVVDGIRQRHTLRLLRDSLADRKLCVIYVHTLPSDAYEFFRSRERPKATPQDFYKIRNAPVEGEVESLHEEADLVIYNWRSDGNFDPVLREAFGYGINPQEG